MFASCNLQTPCILCSRLDHLLDKEKPNNHRNLLCTNHRLEISSLVSCYKHNKLVDVNEMCDSCLCSFATTNNKAKSKSKIQRLILGKLRLDTGGNGAYEKLLNMDSIPHCIKKRPCSCCSKSWKTKPKSKGLLQLKSSVHVATKPNIPYPHRLNSRDSLKKMRDKFFGSVTLEHPGRIGFNVLPHVGYGELRITSDSELDDLLIEEDDKSLTCEKSELKEDFILQSITQIPLKPHSNNFDQVKPSINFFDLRPSPLESYVQVDVQKPHDVKSLACDATFHGLSELNWLPWPTNPTANPSTWSELISLDDASFLASNAFRLCHANSMEKRVLSDSPNQRSTLSCSPESIMLHDDPRVVEKLTTSKETRTDNMEIASLNELRDHSTLISSKVEKSPKIDEGVTESSSKNTNDDTNHNSDSESSESEKKHTNHDSDSESPEGDKKHKNHKGDSESSESDKKHTNHNSDSESSESDKEHKNHKSDSESSVSDKEHTNHKSDSESSESDKEHTNHKSDSESSESDKEHTNHNSDSESSESEKEHEVNFAGRKPLEKETDIITNDLKQPPLISTTAEECSNTNDEVYESDIKNANDDMDHCRAIESSEIGKVHEVFNFTTSQPLENETDLVTNDLKQSPLISTTFEECPKIDEVNHTSVSKSSESDKEQEAFNFSIEQSSKNETDIVTNNLKQFPLINTRVEECPKTDEGAYEYAIKDTYDDMAYSNISEPFESGKEQEILKFATIQSLEKEIDIVTDDLKPSPLINKIVEECPKSDDADYEYAIKNTNDDMDHSNTIESSESGKEPEILNFATRQSLEKETDIVIDDDLKPSPLIRKTDEECPKIDEAAYESTTKNINDDMDHNNISESSESDNEHKIFNFSIGQSSEKETELVTNDLKHSPLINTTIEECSTTNEVVYESAVMNTNYDTDHSNVSESSESDKQQGVFNFATGQPLKMEPDIISNDMEQFSLQNNPVELVNKSSSNDEGHNFSISYDDLQEGFSSEFNITRAFHRSASMESVESLDGSNVSEIKGENMVDRLKRQVEYDKKCINSLYKELEEERNASEVAASQAMAMITRLQEEKAAMHMEALHYLRMMEEQAEYDVEALEKSNELLNEKEREIQDLETELEYYRSNYMVDTIVETEHEQSDGANEEHITAENDIVEHHEYNDNYSFKSTLVEASKGSYRSLNNQASSLEFEDEKIYIQLCLKSLEDKINKIFANGLLAKAPNCIDIEDEVNSEQKGEETYDAERSQRNSEENGSAMNIDKIACNGKVTPEEELVDPDNSDHSGSEESFPNVKVQISCANKREGVDFLALENKISDLTGKLEAVQADYDFLEHSLNSLHYGEEGLQFAHNIVHLLQKLCKLGIRLDRQPGS